MEPEISNFEVFSPQRFLDMNFDYCIPIGVSDFCAEICMRIAKEKCLSVFNEGPISVEDIKIKLERQSEDYESPISKAFKSGKRVLFVRIPEGKESEEEIVGEVMGEITEIAELVQFLWPGLSFKLFIVKPAETIEDLRGTMSAETKIHPRIERIYPTRRDLEAKSEYFINGLLNKKEKIDSEAVKISEHQFFNNSELPVGRKVSYNLDIMGERFHFMTNIKRGCKGPIVAILGAAANVRQTKLPLFSWWRIADGLDQSYVMIEDPMQENKNLDCGWYLGTINRDYLDDIARILSHIIDSQGLGNSDLLLTGGSSGGFASLMLAGRLKGSSVFVDNPQIIIGNYHHRKVVDDSLEIATGSRDKSQIGEEEMWRFDVRRYFEKIGYFPHYLKYTQNEYDPNHIQDHYEPFIEWLFGGFLDNEDEHIITHSTYKRERYDGKRGHLRMSDEGLIKEILDSVEALRAISG